MRIPTFIILPLLCFFCSLYLFTVVLSSKKNRLVIAFMHLLLCFVLWTGGSVLMRLGVWPGMKFWFNISAAGIFGVPFCIYNFLYFYTERRGSFARTVWGIVWLSLIVLNFFDVFMVNQRIETVGGVSEFRYNITYFAIIPIVLAAVILVCAGRMIYRNLHDDGAAPGAFTPLLIGVVVMFVGLIVQSVFRFNWLDTDTVFCGVNAICIYYALYKKRLVTLTSIAANSPVYLLAVTIATVTGAVFFPYIRSFIDAQFPSAKIFVYSLGLSILTMLDFDLLRRLTGKLFVKNREAREKELAQLGRDVSASLETGQTIDVFREFLVRNSTMERAYMCLYDETARQYRVAACTQEARPANFTMRADHPLVLWLRRHGESILYRDFCRTSDFRSMWSSEKQALTDLHADLALPILSEGSLMGVVLLTARSDRSFPPSEISFLESASALVAISFKNASLYAEMEREAQRDTLTELYNHRFFLKKLESDFAECADDKLTMLMVSLDDFRLYNELYGNEEGDRVLQRFGRILESIVAGRGTVSRNSGKEFAVSLPHIDALTAKGIARECRVLLDQEMEMAGYKPARQLTFSAGICTYPSSVTNLDELISCTNLAVYSAKKNGKNNTFVYTPAAAEAHKEGATGPLALSANCANTIYALTAAIDAKDKYTFRHSDNVSRYAAALAEAIPLDAEHVEIVRQAGLLHDIGKIGIPESILTKTGKLTAEEYEIMKQHVEGSIAMIRHLPSLDYLIPAAIGHHERWDGKGYPRGIAGEAIPIGARCLCIADTFDAMTSDRPYRKAMSVETALAEIERNLGLQFDPRLGRLFIDLVREGKIRTD